MVIDYGKDYITNLVVYDLTLVIADARFFAVKDVSILTSP